MHYAIFLVAAVLGILMPDFAWADTLNPKGGNSWDLYVFGNARVVFDVLNSIKMLMVPDAGSSGFQSLLLFMAVSGFLVLAVGAGFDPAKHFIRMFTYILVVGAVSWGSTSLTANVTINDVVSRSDAYVVDRVPALVVLPAALTSQVGRFFTQSIETYFSMPGQNDAFKLTGGSAGQFNLFAKMMQESNEYIFTDPGTKMSLSAYVTDCVVPAIARGKFVGTATDPVTGQTKNIQGAAALAGSNNLMETFATAKHNSIMTKVYPSEHFDMSSLAAAAEVDPAVGVAQGVVLTCKDSYDVIKKMIESNAALMLNASAKAYASTGIMTPYETLFSSMLQATAAPGGGATAYSRPSGFMMQQGMLNSMSGSFRQAAVQTGNNELMTAAAITQAEQNQRSAWVAGFHVFNNMMGYVFTVLQVFIFAITPMVVVALMVPGLGRSIFVNYSQILIWLTLWMPMLALINFVITLFGAESISMTLTQGGGLSLNNKALMTERTNNLVIAAQFLGTMTPLLTWGLVRGAMAFTEFISHGIGSAFATQAGAVAATGNFSTNNLSMDNASANKYNTAMASTVGSQATNAFTTAGALTATGDRGGGNVMAGGSMVSAQKAASAALSKGISESQQISQTLSDAHSQSSSIEQAYERALRSGHGTVSEKAAAQILQSAKVASQGEGAGKDMSASQRKSLEESVRAMENMRSEHNASAKAGGGFNVGFVKAGAETGYTRAMGGSNEHGTGASSGSDSAESVKSSSSASTGTSASAGATATDSHRSTSSFESTQGSSSRMSASDQRVMQDAMSQQDAVTRSLSATQSVVDSFGVNSDLDMATVNQRISAMTGMQAGMANDVAGIESKYAAMGDQLTGRQGETQRAIEAARGTASAAGSRMGGGGGGVPGYEQAKADAQSALAGAQAAVNSGSADVHARRGEVGRQAGSDIADGTFGKYDTIATRGIRNPKGGATRSSADNANPSNWVSKR